MDGTYRFSNADNGLKSPRRPKSLDAHRPPFSPGNQPSTTYWDATAHDVPYPELACQVMILLAPKNFSQNGKYFCAKNMKVKLHDWQINGKHFLKIESRERFHRSDFSELPNEVCLGIGKLSGVQKTLLSMYANQRSSQRNTSLS
jgi:hypothetical protein